MNLNTKSAIILWATVRFFTKFSVIVYKCFKLPLFSHWQFNIFLKIKNVGKITKKNVYYNCGNYSNAFQILLLGIRIWNEVYFYLNFLFILCHNLNCLQHIGVQWQLAIATAVLLFYATFFNWIFQAAVFVTMLQWLAQLRSVWFEIERCSVSSAAAGSEAKENCCSAGGR